MEGSKVSRADLSVHRHDLSVVRHISDRIAVMYWAVWSSGRPRASSTTADPSYTVALLSAVPIPDPAIERKRRRIILTATFPAPRIRRWMPLPHSLLAASAGWAT